MVIVALVMGADTPIFKQERLPALLQVPHLPQGTDLLNYQTFQKRHLRSRAVYVRFIGRQELASGNSSVDTSTFVMESLRSHHNAQSSI